MDHTIQIIKKCLIQKKTTNRKRQSILPVNNLSSTSRSIIIPTNNKNICIPGLWFLAVTYCDYASQWKYYITNTPTNTAITLQHQSTVIALFSPLLTKISTDPVNNYIKNNSKTKSSMMKIITLDYFVATFFFSNNE